MKLRCLMLAAAIVATGCGSSESSETIEDGSELNSRTNPCSGITKSAASAKARQFMIDSGLVLPLDERDDNGVVSKWAALKTVAKGRTCLLVMNAQQTAFGVTSESDVYEVLVVKKKASGGLSFHKFEDELDVPRAVRAGIGMCAAARDGHNGRVLWDNVFYAELKGESALAAAKVEAAGLADKIQGFSADISAKNVREVASRLEGDPDGKLDWDPTPGRTWKVKNPKFSLRRGMTGEALDVASWFFDEDFHGYFSGCSGQVAPWAASCLQRVADGNGFRQLIEYREPPPLE